MRNLHKISLLGIAILGMMMLFGTGCQQQAEGEESSRLDNDSTQHGSEPDIGETAKTDQKKDSFIVILDPGHGGSETGRQAFGYDEKDLNNQLTEKIAKALENRGIRVKYTRHYSEDYDMSIFERKEIANDMEADLYLSIHHDGSIHTEARGVTVFYSTYRPLISVENAYLRSEDQVLVYELIGEVRNLEGRKNYVYLNAVGVEAYADPTHDSLEPFEKYPSQEALRSQSLAGELAEALTETGLWMRGPIDAPYYVARRSIHPAVLIEAGFMTNEEDLEDIIDPIIQQQRAEAIASTVHAFLIEGIIKEDLVHRH